MDGALVYFAQFSKESHFLLHILRLRLFIRHRSQLFERLAIEAVTKEHRCEELMGFIRILRMGALEDNLSQIPSSRLDFIEGCFDRSVVKQGRIALCDGVTKSEPLVPLVKCLEGAV